MASAKQLETVEIADEQLVNTVVEESAGLGVRRYFTIPGRDPFDEIEWEIRDAFIPGKDKPVFEQKGVEFPKFWSQTATNIVAQKYFRGRMCSPERETSVKQMIGRVVDTIGALGPRGRLLRRRGGGRDLRGRAEGDPRQPARLLQLAGLVQRRLRGEAAVLARASSSRSTTRWSRSSTGSAARASSSAAARAPASTSRSCAPRRSSSRRAATPPARSRFMRGADASAGTIKSGGKTRRAAKMVVLDVDHPDVEEFIWCKAHEEEKARVLEAAGYDMSLDSPDWASIQYQNANNSVRVTDAFMEAAEADADWNLTARTDGTVVDTVTRAGAAARRSPRRRGSAPTRASSTTRRSTRGTRSRTRAGSTRRTRARSTCPSTTRACNLASLNLMKFRREDGELDVEAFEHAVDIVFLAQEILVGYSSLPDARDRAQREGLPPARPRLREPRRAADGARARRTTPTRAAPTRPRSRR